MHDEREYLLCRMWIAERLAQAEQARLVREATAAEPSVHRVLTARVGGTLVRVGQWMQSAGEARDVAQRVDALMPHSGQGGPRFAGNGYGRVTR